MEERIRHRREEAMRIEDKEIQLFRSSAPKAPLVLLHTVMDEGEAVYQAAKKATSRDFSLAAIGHLRWDDDMTPWPIPPTAPGDTPCAGLADRHLALLTEMILPAVLEQLPEEPTYIALTGYSLAGLFSIYSAYQTSLFSRIASASGSLWYPGFMEYAQMHAMKRKPDHLYLSLGDREAHTKNAVLRPVEENTRRLAAYWEQEGIHTCFEMNPGSHFQHGHERMARAIAWILEQ